MLRLFWNALKASPVVIVASLLVVNSASAVQTSSEDIASGQKVAVIPEEPITEGAAWTRLPSRDEEDASPVSGSGLVVSETNTILAQSTLETESAIPEATSTLEQIEFYNNEDSVEDSDSSMEQVTNVSQLRDVSPEDWAYEALRSLVERYGCIAGYPDGTFRGNRATTRYEFAAGLNACLNQIERLITGTGEQVTREDFETLQRLVQEFEAELATLGTRVDNLEGRVAFLESHQFSTTTKLTGSADFGLIGAWGDDRAVPSGQTPTEDLDVNIYFPGRVGLNFDTSFTGEDLLRVKFEAGNFTPLDASVTGTDMTLYDFDTRTGPTGNDLVLGSLVYRFPIGDRAEAFIAPQGLGSPDIAPQLSPVAGTISRFGQRNPIYRLSDGAGVGFNIKLSDAIQASFSYLGSPGNFSNPDVGLFDGQYGALAQLTFSPTDSIALALTYVRYYSPEPGEGTNLTGNTGSAYAQTPFGDNIATSANAYGIEAQVRFGPRFTLGGWIGLTDAQAKTSGLVDGVFVDEGDDAQIWNYAVGFAFRDFLREGNALGILFGMPPRVRGNDVITRRDLNTSYRAEAFFRYRVTDNIAITPGAFVIFNPEHNDANDTIFVGTLLTTFSF